MLTSRRVVGLFAVVAAFAASAGPASADTQNPGTLTVHLPCGCVYFNDPYFVDNPFPGAIAIQGGLPVGNAGSTPAAENPSGRAVFTPSA